MRGRGKVWYCSCCLARLLSYRLLLRVSRGPFIMHKPKAFSGVTALFGTSGGRPLCDPMIGLTKNVSLSLTPMNLARKGSECVPGIPACVPSTTFTKSPFLNLYPLWTATAGNSTSSISCVVLVLAKIVKQNQNSEIDRPQTDFVQQPLQEKKTGIYYKIDEAKRMIKVKHMRENFNSYCSLR
jgi:hypothetical protein